MAARTRRMLYYTCIVCLVSNKGLLEECDVKENVAVTGAATASCLKSRMQNVLPNVTYSPSHRQAGTPTINIRSTLRTATDLCTNIALAVLFGSNDNSYTVCTQSDMCTYIHTLREIETLVWKKKMDSSERRVPALGYTCFMALYVSEKYQCQIHRPLEYLDNSVTCKVTR